MHGGGECDALVCTFLLRSAGKSSSRKHCASGMRLSFLRGVYSTCLCAKKISNTHLALRSATNAFAATEAN